MSPQRRAEETEVSRLGYEKPTAPKEFVVAVDEALREIVASKAHSGVLSRFLAAYNQRKSYPWLPESGLNPEAGMENGLVCAFRYALATYIPGRIQHGDPPTDFSPVSEEARKRIEEAAALVVEDSVSILQFSRGLSTEGSGPHVIGLDEIKRHISSALEDYYLLRETATSPDPW
ncbi:MULTISPECIES: hypothetical protein [unclassified Streptomyces]|uniref:hypothetical protein n=1 Tax=unclassified Streptomyces TaxID=2593676 RepID=UPI0011CEC854|nr:MULTISPECIES: hypothetical protein [unclassified Streptomyces]MDQ0790179.1 hypothetical protein [Streptomyces sp. B3I8]